MSLVNQLSAEFDKLMSAIAELPLELRERLKVQNPGAHAALATFELNKSRHISPTPDEVLVPEVESRPRFTLKPRELNETVASFAHELGIPCEKLKNQFSMAGIEKTLDTDSVSPQEKAQLLRHLQRCREKSNNKNVDSTPPPPSPETLKKNSAGTDAKSAIHAISEDDSGHENVKNPSEAGTVLPYDWPGKCKPFAHQITTTNFLVSHERSFCLNDMGTGKTLSVLWAYDFLKRKGTVKHALIVCPLSTMRRTWGDELLTHFRHLRFHVLHGSAEERRKQLRLKADIYLINHDGLKVAGIIDMLANRPDIDLIVVDEIAQAARNFGTDRYKALHEVINKQTPRRAWGLTGTPIPNSPTDAWAQCRLLVPSKVPPYLHSFRDQVMRHVKQFLWVPRPNAVEIVEAAMQPSIRFSRDQCIDLPPVMHTSRETALTDEQKTLFNQMLSRLSAEAREGEITAFNEAIKITKLIQIACGAAYTIDGETAFIPAKDRLEVTQEIIENAGASVIVFTPFRGVLEAVAEFLRQSFTVGLIHGGVSSKQRDEIFHKFQNEKSIRVLVAQASAMSHGLTLTAANTIIWFGPIYDNDIYQQANARISRPGQNEKQLIVNLEGSDVERRVYQRLRDKQKMQGLLLEILQNKNSTVF